MQVSLNTLEWQVLRAVLRHKGPGGCPGSTLRIVPSRRTKNGEHLTGLVEAGLLEAVGSAAPPAPTVGGVPDDSPEPFRTKWKLTEQGKQAAEYGEYDDGTGGLNLPTPEEFTAFRLGEPAKKKKG